MISNKYISHITVVLTCLVLAGCLLAMVFSEPLSQFVSTSGYSLEYPTRLFQRDSVLEISISMEEDKWNEMLQNPQQEVYYECDVQIDGQTFYRVGIRPKGNTSLSSIARDPDNNRYSFKLEFDQFVDGQTCFGLDKLALNNSYADNTNKKEAIVYDMYEYLGADAPLYSYAKINVNGSFWGVYLALEAVEDSFMLRNYGTEKGYLYKPDSMDMGANRNSGGGFLRGGGANLNYTDDSLDSYNSIWNGAVTPAEQADHRRVVTALKGVSEGTNPEAYLDVDNLLKYMAVHNFSVNEDSLSGGMAHNYYLYESGGKLNIIPWDYNLTWGGMGGGDATKVVNDPIDDSYSSTRFFDCLLENEAYRTRYHEYYSKLVTEYFEGGIFRETCERIAQQIDSLMTQDPNWQVSEEEYRKANETLYELILLRKDSVKGQLSGTIPAKTALRTNEDTLVDASHLSLSDMGQFMMGGR